MHSFTSYFHFFFFPDATTQFSALTSPHGVTQISTGMSRQYPERATPPASPPAAAHTHTHTHTYTPHPARVQAQGGAESARCSPHSTAREEPHSRGLRGIKKKR